MIQPLELCIWEDGMGANPGFMKGSYFRDATVAWGDQQFHFSVEDGRALENAGNYWHAPGDPSTWLSVAVFLAARQMVGSAGDDVALALAAEALGITVERLRGNIEWHENYMRWHDGDDSYKVL
jgi:hypothetical protein